MRLFTKSYTTADIHAAIVAKNIILIQQLIEVQKEEFKPIPQKLVEERDRLTKLGLGNTKNSQLLKEEIDKINIENQHILDRNKYREFVSNKMKFIMAMREHFGNHTLLVSYSDFEYILNKYGLVCGLLEHYTGVIPQENIVELEYAKSKLTSINNMTLKYGIIPIRYIKEISTSKAIPNKKGIMRFPFAAKDIVIANNILYDSFELKLSPETLFFIAAPEKDMDIRINMFEFVKPIPEDPFICTLTKYGVMIHTKWGEEAEDKVLNKYYSDLCMH